VLVIAEDMAKFSIWVPFPNERTFKYTLYSILGHRAGAYIYIYVIHTRNNISDVWVYNIIIYRVRSDSRALFDVAPFILFYALAHIYKFISFTARARTARLYTYIYIICYVLGYDGRPTTTTRFIICVHKKNPIIHSMLSISIRTR